MEIRNKDILVLGGWGLVGTALCRSLLEKSPKSITVLSLTKTQAEAAVSELKQYAGKTKLKPAWGNIFVRSDFKDLSREDILENRNNRITLAQDVLERTTQTTFKHFFLYDLIQKTKPQIIIDCVNSATGLAYQDVYSASLKVMKSLDKARSGEGSEELIEEVEKMLTSLYLPQLVRHVQVLYQAMIDVSTKTYVKVGTSGTGGMGLNIPYTHSEDKPSRVLLSKSCVAGAHSLLLFLMGRTPDAPYTKEIKPATAIAWKEIAHGEIKRRGEPIPLYDCNFNSAEKLGKKFVSDGFGGCKPLNENLKSVYIDTGENGTFSIGEFTAITTYEQMEYITPEEIAQTVVWEIEGGATGHDIVGALDASVLGPTYRAGVMRSLAIKKMRELAEKFDSENVAFELLGPPRLSKLLSEAHLLRKAVGGINAVLRVKPETLSQRLEKLIKDDSNLRSKIISIGIPILLSDGERLLRGPAVKVPQDPRSNEFAVNKKSLSSWRENGWVDLSPKNMSKWQDRLKQIKAEAEGLDKNDTSSNILRDATFWHFDEPLDEGEVVGWIFINEDKGRRLK